VGGVSDLVGDRPVDLVADAGEDGHGECRDGTRDRLGIERGQIGSRTPATHERDDVRSEGLRGPQRAHERTLGVDTLSSGIHDRDVEADARSAQLVDHIGVGGAADTGHQCDPQRQHADRDGSVRSQQAVGGQRRQHPLALQAEDPERVPGVDPGHAELDRAAHRIRAESPPDADAHAVDHAHHATPLRGAAAAQERFTAWRSRSKSVTDNIGLDESEGASGSTRSK
jgi:hypothetical protein